MALTKVTGKGITCSAVTEDKLGTSAVTTNKIGPNAVTSAKINNGSVTADDLASTLDLSSKTVTLASDLVTDLKRPVQDNIALLGFKMAVNDGLTVFNLVDGVVDEFNDESGTDEAEGSNDLYNCSSDYYINSTSPDGLAITGFSAGFAESSITEPDTTTSGCGSASHTFTVPCGATSGTLYAWGAGGSKGNGPLGGKGGGGGFAKGCLAISPGQTIYVYTGEAGLDSSPQGGRGGIASPAIQGGGVGEGTGGGASIISSVTLGCISGEPQAPAIYMVGAGGGGAGSCDTFPGRPGGAGGGLIGDGGAGQTERNSGATMSGGGGDQEQGGQASSCGGNPGSFLAGGSAGGLGGGGGSGYYGGGGAANYPIPGNTGGGGGGSSYFAHPQITCGSTEEGAANAGGGTADPNYVAGTNEGADYPGQNDGEDGYVLFSATPICATATSTTIVSTAFTSTSVATSARIVVFEENVDTPTLNTDIIASVSRDGTNFTNATLTDSGYVTGSSGQRILTGQADISGQPSGQSMRWKLALANNQVKIHGVALQWS